MNRHRSLHWWKPQRTYAAADNPVGWTVPDVRARSSHGECHLHGLWSPCTHRDSFEASPQLPQLLSLTQTQRTRKQSSVVPKVPSGLPYLKHPSAAVTWDRARHLES